MKRRLEQRLAKDEVLGLVDTFCKGEITKEEIGVWLRSENPQVLFNAYWLLAITVHRQPGALEGLEEELLQGLKKHAWHDGAVRCILTVFKIGNIPESFAGDIYLHSFALMRAPSASIAPRSFAISICAKIAKANPELQNELLPEIARVNEMYGSASPGIRSAAKNAFKLLTPRSNKWYP